MSQGFNIHLTEVILTNLILPLFFRVLGIIRCTKNQKTQTYNANENRPKVFYKVEIFCEREVEIKNKNAKMQRLLIIC